MMSDWEIIGLVSSAAAGGAINAVAGGGTLVTFPTLLAFGTSPIIANAGSGAGAATRAGTAGPVAGMAGFDGTVATSPMGAPGGSTAVKSLLGG